MLKLKQLWLNWNNQHFTEINFTTVSTMTEINETIQQNKKIIQDNNKTIKENNKTIQQNN